MIPARTTPDGLVFGQRFEFSKKHILESVNGILERLQTDYLDVFLLHRPDPLMEPEEVAAAFDELHNAGKVRQFGVSNFNRAQVELVQDAVNQRLLVNQLQFGIKHTPMIDAGLYVNRFETDGITRDGGGLLEFCHRTKMTVQAWSPYQYGMFEGIFLDNPAFPELNAKLEELAGKYGTNKSAIATAWITRMPQGIQVILGSMNPKHLSGSIEGVDIDLDYQDWYDLYFAAGHLLP